MKSLQRMFRLVLLGLVISVLTACGSDIELFNAMQESDANEVLAALLKEGIPVHKVFKKDGVSVVVSSDSSSRALQILEAQGLPRVKQDGIGQVFKKDSLISSPLEERARYLYALSQEVEKTIMSMDGVITARVHVVLPERMAPGEPLQPSSAAVFIKYKPSIDFRLYTAKVRSLVFNSIPGLSGDEREKVTIVALPAQSIEPAGESLSWYGSIGVTKDSDPAFRFAVLLVLSGWLASVIGLLAYFKRDVLIAAIARVKGL